MDRVEACGGKWGIPDCGKLIVFYGKRVFIILPWNVNRN